MLLLFLFLEKELSFKQTLVKHTQKRTVIEETAYTLTKCRQANVRQVKTPGSISL